MQVSLSHSRTLWLLPLALASLARSLQNRRYDIGVPHYNNNINNLRPTQMTFSMTTVRANSKIFVRTNFVMACHGSSHVCEYSPFHDNSHSSTLHTHTHTYTHMHTLTNAHYRRRGMR